MSLLLLPAPGAALAAQLQRGLPRAAGRRRPGSAQPAGQRLRSGDADTGGAAGEWSISWVSGR